MAFRSAVVRQPRKPGNAAASFACLKQSARIALTSLFCAACGHRRQEVERANNAERSFVFNMVTSLFSVSDRSAI
jgi:hypothetical protein